MPHPITAAAIAALTTLTLIIALAVHAGGGVGQKAGELSLEPASGGKSISLAQFKGKPVLVVFWAVWCPPCRREIPALKELQAKYAPKGLEVISVGIQYRQTRAAVVDFKTKNSLPYEVLWDAEGKVAQEYSISSVPTNLLIDAEGVVRFRNNSVEPALFAAIEKALPKESTPKG
jgi:thiol-disulfide isomerase/thioredoxin